MARRGSIEAILLSTVREYSRQQRMAIQAARVAERQAEIAERRRRASEARNVRQFAATQRERERLAKQSYLTDRESEVVLLNEALSSRMEELSNVLQHTLTIDDAIDFNTLRRTEAWPDPPAELVNAEPQPDSRRHFQGIRKPSLFQKLIPGSMWRFEGRLRKAKQLARAELEDWHTRETDRVHKLTLWSADDEHRRNEFVSAQQAHNQEVDGFEKSCQLGEPEALAVYFSMVLERSEYPSGFPQNFSTAYQPDSKMLVVRYELPSPQIVPRQSEYRYVRTRDSIDEKARKPAEIKAVFADIVAAVVLRTVHELFESDVWEHLQAVAVNGMVKAIDPANGKDIEPCLISVRTTRADFLGIDLARVDKAVCLRNLGAQVSRSPEEIVPVKPIVEFRMTDPRFVDQSDIVSDLSAAANLMDLNPYEFEELVANLFGKLGLESKLTRASRDGGVDCVAFDPRPILGGKVVIQAKRYKHTVGVSAVRDLFGTMMNEGASKGLLVTTSGYGPDAFQFAKDKPIELIDGGGLLYLLNEIGVQARIVMPTE